jgi:hypothetical protein
MQVRMHGPTKRVGQRCPMCRSLRPRAALIGMLFVLMIACESRRDVDVAQPLSPADAKAAAIRAEAHLKLLRARDWDGAAALTVCQDGTSGPAAARALQAVYQACRPGPLIDGGTLIPIDHLAEPYRSQVGRRIYFSYHCDDLDGLEMRWLRDNWFRALDSCELKRR